MLAGLAQRLLEGHLGDLEFGILALLVDTLEEDLPGQLGAAAEGRSGEGADLARRGLAMDLLIHLSLLGSCLFGRGLLGPLAGRLQGLAGHHPGGVLLSHRSGQSRTLAQMLACRCLPCRALASYLLGSCHDARAKMTGPLFLGQCLAPFLVPHGLQRSDYFRPIHLDQTGIVWV